MINAIIHTAICILIGWLLIEYIPRWLSLKGIISLIVKIVGVLVIIGALLEWT